VTQKHEITITSTPNVLVCSPIVCKEDVVNAYTPSHVLSATNDVISPRFEKHTIDIGPQLLSMMGYTGGGLWKNEQVIIAHVTPKLKSPITCLGYEMLPHYVHLTLP